MPLAILFTVLEESPSCEAMERFEALVLSSRSISLTSSGDNIPELGFFVGRKGGNSTD